MQREFLLKTFGDMIEKSSPDEIRTIICDFVALLYHRTNFESMERYKLLIEGIIAEIDHEISMLDTKKTPAQDISEDLACTVGTIFLKTLREILVDAIEHCDNV